MVRDIETYDLRLRDDFRLMCAHFANKRRGGESPYSYNQIADVATNIARELDKRGGKFHPKDYSSPYSRELFRIVNRNLGREGIVISKAFDGLYLVEPHPRLIWKGFKKLIVKLKRYEGKMHVPLYLLGDKAYGFITLTSVREIDRDEFEGLRDRHLISDKERSQWWDDKFPLYVYEFRFEKFDKPKNYVHPQGIQVFINDVRIEKIFEEENQGIKPPFPTTGGKFREAKELVKLIPEHSTYVEPYCGAASVFFRKKRSDKEILNDEDEHKIQVFKFMRDGSEADFKKLREKRWESDKSYWEKLKDAEEPDDLIESVYKFLYVTIHSYHATGGFVPREEKSEFLKNLELYKDRLKDVELSTKKAINLIEEEDEGGVFFFIDPPYEAKEEIEKLSELLPSLKGEFILTLNDSYENRELLKKLEIFRHQVIRGGGRTESKMKYELWFHNYPFPKEKSQLLAKALDFDLEAIDSRHVAGLSDSELSALYRKLHEAYRERGEVFEALLNASIFVEGEMERRGLKREFDDGLSRETAFWISEYPPPRPEPERKEEDT